MKKMYFHISILLSVLFIYTSTIAQDTWTQVGYGGLISSITMATSTTGYALGSDNKLFKTTDGGNTWLQLTNTNLQAFTSLYFFDANNGWACGGDFVQQTTDGGVTWVTKILSSGSFFGSIYFVSPTQGWVAGYHGKILKTTDGGMNWSDISVSNINTFHKIYFRNANLGWALTPAEFYKTTDGGNTWTNVYSPSNNTIYDFEFTDDNTGFISGSGGFLLKSIDGGGTWTPINSGVPNELEDISFIDGNTGWICGRGGQIIKTTNSGDSWTPQNSTTASDFYSMVTIDANIVLTSGRGGKIYKTGDGGNSWAPANTAFSSSQFNLTSVFFLNQNLGWMSALSGEIVKTSDGGHTWTSQNPNGSINTLTSVYFINSNEGWAAGAAGTVFHTIDGGSNWNLLNTGTSQFFDDIYFFDSNNGWAYSSTFMLHTTNGGSSWTSSTPPVNFLRMTFQDANNGKAIGSDGLLYTTTNGGSSWTGTGTPISGGFLNYAYFSDANTGYAVSVSLTRGYKTTNGGLSWSVISPALFPNSTRSIYFTDNNNGWIVGDNGYISKTSNGGTTWATQNSNTTTILSRITGINGVIFAIGQQGTVLKNNFAAALPVKLLSFTASIQNNYPYLQWNADNETGFSRYEIERSGNGRDFTYIGYRDASAGTGVKTYNFLDKGASIVTPSKYYYRLKMIDGNGSYSYSKVASVLLRKQNLVSIVTSPNPFTDKITVQLDLPEASIVAYKLIDLCGKIIVSNAVNLSNGIHNEEIGGLKQLPQGIYILQIQTGSTLATIKILK